MELFLNFNQNLFLIFTFHSSPFWSIRLINYYKKALQTHIKQVVSLTNDWLSSGFWKLLTGDVYVPGLLACTNVEISSLVFMSW